MHFRIWGTTQFFSFCGRLPYAVGTWGTRGGVSREGLMYASKASQSIGLLPLLELSITNISKIYTYNESSGRLSLNVSISFHPIDTKCGRRLDKKKGSYLTLVVSSLLTTF